MFLIFFQIIHFFLLVARLETEENKLLIWDLGGSSSIRSIWKKYFSDAEALIYIVDATMNEQQLQESYESFGTIYIQFRMFLGVGN